MMNLLPASVASVVMNPIASFCLCIAFTFSPTARSATVRPCLSFRICGHGGCINKAMGEDTSGKITYIFDLFAELLDILLDRYLAFRERGNVDPTIKVESFMPWLPREATLACYKAREGRLTHQG